MNVPLSFFSMCRSFDLVASRPARQPSERSLQLSSAVHRSWVPSSQSAGISDHFTESANFLALSVDCAFYKKRCAFYRKPAIL